MKDVSEFKKKALEELVKEAPAFLESLGKALSKGASLEDLQAELSVERFDGSYAIANIDRDGDVEWE